MFILGLEKGMPFAFNNIWKGCHVSNQKLILNDLMQALWTTLLYTLTTITI
jgi:hypothetical protein